jgi:hypothetical protein
VWSSAAPAAIDGVSDVKADAAANQSGAHSPSTGDISIVDEVVVTGRRLTTAAGPNVSAGGANDYAVTSEGHCQSK